MVSMILATAKTTGCNHGKISVKIRRTKYSRFSRSAMRITCMQTAYSGPGAQELEMISRSPVYTTRKARSGCKISEGNTSIGKKKMEFGRCLSSHWETETTMVSFSIL